MKKGIPRSIEILAALFGILMSFPLFLIGIIGVALSSPGPIFFKQERVGRKGKLFLLIKFRSMRMDNEGPQVTAKGDRRITRFGNILRKTKIDELPELVNVIRGDLSLVGPRPEVPKYVNPKNLLWRKILETRPGLTDPVTLKLRNEEELVAQIDGDAEKFYLEVLQSIKLKGYVEYLEGRTCWTDIKVLFQSIFAVILSNKTPPPTLSELKNSNFKL